MLDVDGWPPAAQWGVLLVLAATYYGTTWWLVRREVRREADGAPTPVGLKQVVGSFRWAEWAVTATFLAFLVPLTVRSLTG